MAEKTKFDYEMEAFDQAFREFRDKKIVVYGTGRMTATLIEYNTQFQIIGLCDRESELIGKEMYGLPIISREQAEQQADMLIINTGSSYWNTIYKRIADWKLPIYFRNGEQAVAKETNDAENPYWQSSYEQLYQKACQYEIVSFDVFDTILMRKVMSPLDVFRIVENRLSLSWGLEKAKEYIPARKLASSRLDNPSLEELFEEVGRIAGWTSDEIRHVMEYEIEAELAVITARRDMVSLYDSLKKSVTIYFVSDMYYSADVILRFLHAVGVDASLEQVIVSCDLKKDKVTGKLWEWYQQNIVKGLSAFHIGDNQKADSQMPKQYGIDTYWIMNAQDQLEHSSICNISEKVVSLHSSLALGCVCAKLFNSPFALNVTKGKIKFKSNVEAGYSILGNLAYDFALWLALHVQHDQIEQLLFFARDGYLLYQQYEYLSELLGQGNWADAEYLEISRRAIWGAGAINWDGLYVAACFPYKGNARDFLKDRFGVVCDNEELDSIDISELQKDNEGYRLFLQRYQQYIYEHAEAERKNYLTYLQGIGVRKRAAVVDSSLYGSTQFYLQRLLGRSFKGYYMCACLDESNAYIPENDMIGCFQAKDDLAGKKCAVNEYADFVESFYTAPNGMVICIDENGKAVYGPDMSNQKYFDVRNEMQEGIYEFFREMTDLYRQLGLDVYQIDELFADELLRVFMKDGFIPTQGMKDGFFYDNGVMHHAESKIWD